MGNVRLTYWPSGRSPPSVSQPRTAAQQSVGVCLGPLWRGHRTAITMACKVFDDCECRPMPDIELAELTPKTLVEFCKDFINNPYRCYTEHGLHALFFTKLYKALPDESTRYVDVAGSEIVCVIQKEYPTHDSIGRSRRQHWDTAVIKTPVVMPNMVRAYDHLRLAAVVEFGTNVGRGHLEDDIDRLSDKRANVDLPLAAHFYRFSPAAARVSRRDWSANAVSRFQLEEIPSMLPPGSPVTVYFGHFGDTTPNPAAALWQVTADRGVEPLVPLEATV